VWYVSARSMHGRPLLVLSQNSSRKSVFRFLEWKEPRKSQTFRHLIDLLAQEGVNTEDELREWLPAA
jgi:hypothetical protein